MEKQIKVIVKRPGELPKLEVIDNTLESFRRVVGGDIQVINAYNGGVHGVFVVNEAGKRDEFRFNVDIHLDFGHPLPTVVQLYGNIIYCGVGDDNFTDTPFDVRAFRSLFGVVR